MNRFEANGFLIEGLSNDPIAWFLGYSGKSKKIVIPEEINGYRIEFLGPRVFERSMGLAAQVEEVVIPGSVKAIEDCCFEGKTALKRVVIEDGVKYIRAYAFRNCRNLEEVTIPDSVCSIGGFGHGGNPFQGCKRVKVIAKPGSYAEEYCHAHGIMLDEPGSRYVKERDMECMLHSDGTADLMVYSGKAEDAEIPARCQKHQIVAIRSEAIEARRLIRIPHGVQRLDKGMISGSYRMSCVVVPKSVTMLAPGCLENAKVFTPKGSSAEAYCEKEKIVHARAGEKYLCEKDCVFVLYADGTALLADYRGSAKSFTVPRSCAGHKVTKVLDKAFRGLEKLQEVRIPTGVELGEDNFEGCGLTRTQVPNGNYAHLTELQNDPWARKEYGLYDPIDSYHYKTEYHVKVTQY